MTLTGGERYTVLSFDSFLGSPTDQVSRAIEIPDAANPWSTKFHVDERPINEAWPSKTKKESKDKTLAS